MKKAFIKRKVFKILGIILFLAICLFVFYFNNLKLVNVKAQNFYYDLKDSLKSKGYSASLIVVSAKRAKLHNDFQVKFSGAAKDSKHLVGDAIDFIVFDINNDGHRNYLDADIVYNILDKMIIKDQGGIGTYKGESSFFNQQMIHIDCRGHYARWAR